MWYRVLPGMRHGGGPLLVPRVLSHAETAVGSASEVFGKAPDRYGDTLCVQYAGCVALANVGLKPDETAGCRVVGEVLDEVLKHAVDGTPRVVLWRVKPVFTLRGLLTLSYLALPRERREVMLRFSREFLADQPGEQEGSYEKRASRTIKEQYPGAECAGRSTLRLGGRGGSPDELCLVDNGRELLVIEAKKRRVGFGEGGSQIIQYFAQARNRPEYQGLPIRSVLVTSDAVRGESYLRWEAFLRSDHEVEFLVREEDLPPGLRAPWL